MRDINFKNPILEAAFEVKEDGSIGLKYGFNSGGYESFQIFYTDDGGVLAYSTVIDEFDKVNFCDPDDKQWFIIGVDVNYENHNLYDSHTGNKIETAFEEDCDNLEDLAVWEGNLKSDF